MLLLKVIVAVVFAMILLFHGKLIQKKVELSFYRVTWAHKTALISISVALSRIHFDITDKGQVHPASGCLFPF